MAAKKTFRVATEGATCDGRTLSREQLVQMAESYNPAVYGARINLEHMRGLVPDGPFRALGDVTALEAREVENGKMALFATIDPTEELVAMVNKARQKVYASIEIMPNFARTGEAYMVGLAVTDSPASLGCEMLKFAAGAAVNPLAGRKFDPSSLFSEGELVEMSFEPEAASGPSILERVKSMFTAKNRTDAARFDDLEKAIALTAEKLAERSEDRYADKSLENKVEALNRDLTALTEKLSAEPAPGRDRPAATGGAGSIAETEF